MNLQDKKLQEVFNELSVAAGGSLYRNHPKMRFLSDSNMLFIGIGGLGLKTINEIKKNYIRDFDKSSEQKVDFLGIDSCHYDLDYYTLKREGVLEEQEIFYISSFGSQYYNTRKKVREMLCNTENYNHLRNIMQRKIQTLTNNYGYLHVFLISGTSGATGSGLLIDVAYMIKDIRKNLSLWGVLYTPDMHNCIKHITPQQREYMYRNGYATFKELDYLMTKTYGTMYEFATSNNNCREQLTRPPFYRGQVFVISPTEHNREINDVVNSLARSILFMFSKVGCGLEYGHRLYESTWNCYLYHLDCFSANGSEDLTGIKDTTFPVFMNYCYSSLNHSTVKVPIDEIIAYCTNRLVERLIEYWKQSDITEEELKAIFRKYHIASNKAFAGTIFNLSNCAEFFYVKKSEMPVDGFGPFKVKNCKSYLDLMRSTAEQEGTAQRVKALLEIARQNQDKIFVNPLISLIDKAFQRYEVGPIYAINLISGDFNKEKDGKFGILAWIKKLIEELPNDVISWRQELELVYLELKAKAERYDRQLSIDAKDLELFTNDCRQYGEDLLSCYILLHAKDYLVEILNKLNEQNKKVYQVYTDVFNYLVETLKNDSEYFTKTSQYKKTFPFDLASNHFKKLFDSIVDSKDLYVEARRFISMVFGKLEELWEPKEIDSEIIKSLEEVNGPCVELPDSLKHDVFKYDDLVCIIRKYVNTVFSDMDLTALLQKVFVWGYTEDRNDDITLVRLDEICNAEQGTDDRFYRDDAINAALLKIVSLLETEDNLRDNYGFPIDWGYHLYLPEAMRELCEAVLSKMSERSTVRNVEYIKGFTMHSAKFLSMVALPMFKNFENFAFEYLKIESKVRDSESVHLNDNMRWYLPEIFGVDAVEHFSNLYKTDLSYLDTTMDAELYNKIHVAIGAMLKKGLIYYEGSKDHDLFYVDVGKFNVIVDICSTDNFETLKNYCNENLSRNRPLTLIDCLKETRDKTKTVSYIVVPLDCRNVRLLHRGNKWPEDESEITNLDRIVRNDENYIKLILENFYKIEKKENVFWNEIVPLF